MVNTNDRLLNPMLALVQLYKKDGKDFNALTKDIISELAATGIPLDEQYVKDKVLPWVFSFLFMTMGQHLLETYITNLSNLQNRKHTPPAPPSAPPVSPN